MKRKFLKCISLIMAISIPILAFSGCGKKTSSAEAASSGKIDTSKSVTVTWYIFGSPAKDQDKVLAEFNKMAQKDLNTTLDLKFIDWNDWQTKYNLLLSSGEKMDAIFASGWASFFKYAKQGAFMDITNMIPKYMPETWANAPKQDWNDVTLGGKIFAVPCTDYEYTPNGFLYREDWRKKYNLPEIKDLDSIEAYLAGIKENMPNSTPIANNSYNEISTLFEATAGFEVPGGDAESLIRIKSYKTPNDIVAMPFTEEFANWCKRMKTWVDKGYISKNSLASKLSAADAVGAGTGAIEWCNPTAGGGVINNFKKSNPDWQFNYFPFTRINNYAYLNSSINNGMAIPTSSENPERSLMLLDKIRNNPDYFRLLEYGIKGTDYDLTDDGKNIIVPAKGQDPKSNSGYSIASWGWRNKAVQLTPVGTWEGLSSLVKEFDAEKVPNIYTPVYIDYDSCTAELAAVNQVKEQYGKPLMMGLVPDVDKAVKEYRDKLKAAGIDKVLEAVKTSMTEYYKEKGIK